MDTRRVTKALAAPAIDLTDKERTPTGGLLPRQIRAAVGAPAIRRTHGMLSELVKTGKAELTATIPTPATPLFGREQAAAAPLGTVAHPCRVAEKAAVQLETSHGQVRIEEATEVDIAAAKARLTGGLPPRRMRKCTDRQAKPRLVQCLNNFANPVLRPATFAFSDPARWLATVPKGWLLMSRDESAAFNALYVPVRERGLFCCAARRPNSDKTDIIRMRIPGFGCNLTPAWYCAVKAAITEGVNAAAGAAGWTTGSRAVEAYMDDTAAAAPEEEATNLFKYLGNTLTSHGLVVNEKKSAPPAPTLQHVGFTFTEDRSRPSLPDEKAKMLKNLCQLLTCTQADVRVWRSVCGKLRNMAPALGPRVGSCMYGAWAQLRRVQRGAALLKDVGGGDPDLAFTLRTLSQLAARASTDDRDPADEAQGARDLPETPTRTVVLAVTDASEDAAGAAVGTLEEEMCQVCARLGNPHEGGATSSTERELLAALLGLRAATKALDPVEIGPRPRARAKTDVVIVTDNQGAAACINRRAGRTYGTARATAAIFETAHRVQAEVAAVWVPRKLTLRADLLSRIPTLAIDTFPDARRLPWSMADATRAVGIPPRRAPEENNEGARPGPFDHASLLAEWGDDHLQDDTDADEGGDEDGGGARTDGDKDGGEERRA